MRTYNKKWISERSLNKMSLTELEQFLSHNLIQISFTNYDTNDLKELCYANGLVKSFETRGRKAKPFTKFDLLKLCQKCIKENNLDEVYQKFGTATITLTKNLEQNCFK